MRGGRRRGEGEWVGSDGEEEREEGREGVQSKQMCTRDRTRKDVKA